MNNGTVLLILTFCGVFDTLFGLIATPQKILTKKKFSRAGKNGSVVYIDVENVRGKSGFKLTHENLIKSSQIWAKKYGLEGHVSLIVDHGKTANGYYLRDNNNQTQSHLSIIFSGEGMKADDVIVRDVKFCHEQLLRDLIVVTADTELIKRCKREAAKARKTYVQGRSKKGKGRLKEEGRELEIVQPLSFLEDLEDVVKEEVTLMNNYNNKTLLVADIRSNNNNTEEAAVELDEATSAMEEEISLQGKLIAIQTQLSSKSVKKISPNKRRKLQRSEMRLRTKLGQMQSKTKTKINDTTTSLSSTTDDDESTVLNNLLKKWKDIRKTSSRKELTGDRILLAEGLRRELEHITPPSPYVALDEEEEEEEDFSLLLDGEYLRNKMNTPAEAHVCYVNTLIYKEQHQKRKAKANKKRQKEVVQSTRTVDFDKKDTIRLVIISDTHGLERSLTNNHFEPWCFTSMKEKENSPYDDDDDDNVSKIKNGDDDSYKLPEGDILLHLGDFAVDKSLNARNRAIVAFDKWLSQFSYPVKIILRGNHDPKNAEFPISGATYVNEPKTINFGSKVVMACVPHGVVATSKSNKKKNNRYSSSSSSSSRSILPCTTCDILATHEPPRNILDKCLDGEFAGSSALRIAVDNMRGMKPKLWVCGHIHEGRGAVRTTFGTKNNNNNNQQRETLVINAANANPGRAEQIVYGPVVVDISSNTSDDDDGVMMDYNDTPAPKEYNNNNLQTEMIKKRENVKDGEKELLLAIDLGLNCGASMFDDSGRLLRYEQLRFQNEEDLYQGAPELIESWVQDVNDLLRKEKKEDVKCSYSLSYLVIEGGGHYLDAWEESLNNNNNNNNDVQLICIRPEEWRSYLLTDKEKESSRACKEAARLIARQIVFEHSSKKKHEGKFKTDCAESVSIGYYMASRLGWVKKDPLVNRYSNGKVIVPR